VAAPVLPAAALERLPRGEFGVAQLDDDSFWRLVAGSPTSPSKLSSCRS
jgi:hypothetical protein